MLTATENLFKIFADKNRLRILKLLAARKMCVCELTYVLGVTQPSISRHLKKMRKAGLIGAEQDGLWTNYFLKKGTKEVEDVLRCIKSLLHEDKGIKSDQKRLRRFRRTNLLKKGPLCC